MTEEEQKAIENIKKDIEEARTIERIVGKESVKDIKYYEIVLNLISNLQKELDKKDKKIKQLRDTILNYQGTTGILLKMEDKDE